MADMNKSEFLQLNLPEGHNNVNIMDLTDNFATIDGQFKLLDTDSESIKAMIEEKADNIHTHEMSDVKGLDESINDLIGEISKAGKVDSVNGVFPDASKDIKINIDNIPKLTGELIEIKGNIRGLEEDRGDMSNLKTGDVSSIVGAINELNELKKLRNDGSTPLKAHVSSSQPAGEDGRIYYNSTQKLFYVYRDGQWYRLFVAGDAKLEQNAPNVAPELESKSDTSIKLKPAENMEYRYQGGAWQEDATFQGLQRNETYWFEQRFKEDDVYKASPASPALSVTTDKGNQTAPAAPGIHNIDFDRVTVNGGSNTEVRIDSGLWYTSPHTFTGLREQTTYKAYARKRETNTHKPSPQSTGTTFTTPAEAFLYGVKIDENNSNPQTAVTYIEDCVGFTPANGINQNWGSWKSFVDEYLSTYVTLNLSTRQETQQIDPNNWTKTTSGGTAVLDGSKGDLMWKVPKLYWKFERKGTDLYIYLSDKKLDSGFVCLAHTKGASERDYIYYSVMLGTEKSGKLRSIDGGTPANDKTIGDFRSLCEANGTDIHMLPYYPWLLYQIIVLILGKNRDTQAQWGNNQSSNETNVAKNLSKGMIFGQSAKGSGVNAFIADPWGNQRFWIDGMKYDSNYNILVGTTNFNNDAKGYESIGKTSSLSWGGIDKVHGTSKAGFVPTSTSGSTSTHYADEGYVYSGSFPSAGGNAGYDSNAGTFYWYSHSASGSYSSLSARIFAYGE